MMNLIEQDLVYFLGLTLLHFLWQGVLVGLVYGLILLLWRPVSANARYNLAVATLLSLAALPALTLGWLLQQAQAGLAGVPGLEASATALIVSDPGGSAVSEPMLWIVAAWLAGVVVLSIRLAIGWHFVLRLRHSADHSATTALVTVVESIRSRLAIGRQVMLAASDKVRAPLVIGYLKPLILFPPAMLNRLSLDQIEMILAHEMAHIRRHDHLVNLFQTVVETLLFYHPVVAWVSRHIRIERENACDDLAVDITGNRLGYVEMLATLEQMRYPLPRLALSIQDGQILGRVRRLVEPRQAARQRGLTLPAVAVIILVASTTAFYLVPENETNGAEPAGPVDPSTSVENRGDRDIAPSLSSPAPSIDDPLGWDFPDPLPAPEPDTALSFNAAAAISTDPLADNSGDNSADPASEIAPSPESNPLPATAAATSTSAEPDSANAAIEETETSESVAAIQTEPLTDSASTTEPLQLAALPTRARPQPEPPSLTEIELPPITGGELINRVEPRFPTRARQRRASGLVELEFTVTPDGRTRDIQVIENAQDRFGFAHAAREAVNQWQFEPFRQGDERLARRVRVEIEFDPDEGCLDVLGSRIPRC